MNVSIAISTYNRAEELRRTLMSLAELHPVTAEWEVLVVGNRCTDSTAEMVRRVAPRFCGRLRYVEETWLGLSHARNRAVVEARHEIIAFLDDDVDVDPGWLDALIVAHASDDVAAVGGRATLRYPGNRPKWLDEPDVGLLTRVELGDHRRRARADELYGLNLSFRRDWVERVGTFRTDLGRVGKCLLGGEETELLERIEAAGGLLLYEPGARVWHRVPPERLRRAWFLSRRYWGSRGEAINMPAGQVTAYTSGRSWWRLARAALAACRALIVTGPFSAYTFHHVGKVAGGLGLAMGISARYLNTRVGRSIQVQRGFMARPQTPRSAPVSFVNDSSFAGASRAP